MRIFYQQARAAFIAFDERLDAWAERHRIVLHAVGIVLAFCALLAGVALHAYESGLAAVTAARCGTMCSGVPGEYGAALLWGAVAIVFVKLYAVLLGTVQRRIVDPWKYVRPEPAPSTPPRWTVVLLVIVGLVVFFVMAYAGGIAGDETGSNYLTFEGPKYKLTLGGRAMLEWVVGWCIGGRGVLRYFWPRPIVRRHDTATSAGLQ
jgi:hypothetical protein